MQNTNLSLSDYWDILIRRKWSLLIPMGVVMLFSAVVAVILPSLYQSYSTILIEEQHIPTEFVMTTVNTYAEQRVENIKQRVLSFSQLWDIIKQHNLYAKLREKLTPEEVVDKMRKHINVQTLSADIFDRRTGRTSTVATAFTLSFEGGNPQSVLRVTDTLTSLFLEQNLQVRQQRVTETSDFLKAEAARIKKELSKVEKELAIFKQKHVNELPELFQVNKQSLDAAERSIENYRSQLRSLHERQGYLSAQLASVSPYVESVADQNRDAEMLKNLQMQLSSLRERYTDQYPDIKVVKAQIAELERRGMGNSPDFDYTAESKVPDNPAYVTLNSQLASTEAEIQSVNNQIKVMENKIELYRTRVENTPKVEESYQTMVDHKSALLGKFNDLNSKYQEAKVAQELEKGQKGERFTLIEPARLPETPIKPNRMGLFLIGFVMSMGVGIGYAAIREFADQSVRSSEALSRLTNVPVLAAIPKIVTEAEEKGERGMHVKILGASAAMVCVCIVIFHFFVMDLDIFWAKLGRWIARM